MTQRQTIKAAAQIDRRAVIKALIHLEAIEEALKSLDKDENKDPAWAGPWNALYAEKRKLIAAFSAYQEAAWRMAMGQQSGEREGGVFDIFDPWVGDYVPLVLPEIPNVDGVALNPGDTILLKNQSDTPDRIVVVAEAPTHVDKFFGKSRTSKLTPEQRRANGQKGAAKKQDSMRRSRARDTGKYHLYGITKDYGLLPEKYTLMGGPFGNMRSAFRHLTRNLNSYDGFVVYDNKGHRWNYDPEVHNLTKLNP